jgi:hypothetical protein
VGKSGKHFTKLFRETMWAKVAFLWAKKNATWVKRNKVGRLKLRIEAAMSEEWFLWTDISASPGYPVGSGALIHSSAAKHISRLQLEKPPNVDDGDWRRAIDGRVFGVTLTRPGTTGPIQMMGVNQHVASSENAHLRAILSVHCSVYKC